MPGEERDRLAVPTCGHIAYVNPRLVVTTIPVTDAGEVVLLRRGFEPGRGWWAQPGGFLEVDETADRGRGPGDAGGDRARRRGRRDHRPVCAARGGRDRPRLRGAHRRRRAREPAPRRWRSGPSRPRRSRGPSIAFRTTWWALVDWLARRRPDLAPPPDRWAAELARASRPSRAVRPAEPPRRPRGDPIDGAGLVEAVDQDRELALDRRPPAARTWTSKRSTAPIAERRAAARHLHGPRLGTSARARPRSEMTTTTARDRRRPRRGRTA